MITIRSIGAPILVAAAMLALAPPARAAEPTLSDIATCNEQAAARTSGAALPRPDAPSRTAATKPIVEGERDLPKSGEKSDSTGAIITDGPDPLVKGMDAQRADDPAYRAAYRACMQKRATR
jgi:hypothetical protein